MNLSISTAEGIAESRAFLFQKGSECYRDLPWRGDLNPWHILLSEVMLQQTQVPRVASIFPVWREKYPTPSSFASLSVAEALAAWSGLGYNRRALSLHKTAKILAKDYRDTVPPTEDALRALPGIGPYTVRAILAFAFDIPSVFLETNIRAVYIRHFFEGAEKVGDADLEAIGRALLDESRPRAWYTALMDYGSWLKAHELNFTKKAATYRPQARFQGSERQLRGAILKALLKDSPASLEALSHELKADPARLWNCAERLEKEGFIEILPSKERTESVSETGLQGRELAPRAVLFRLPARMN